MIQRVEQQSLVMQSKSHDLMTSTCSQSKHWETHQSVIDRSTSPASDWRYASLSSSFMMVCNRVIKTTWHLDTLLTCISIPILHTKDTKDLGQWRRTNEQRSNSLWISLVHQWDFPDELGLIFCRWILCYQGHHCLFHLLAPFFFMQEMLTDPDPRIFTLLDLQVE